MQPAFIALFNISPQATFSYASESVYDVLGYEPMEILNKNWVEFYHPDEVGSIMGLFLANIRDDVFGAVLTCRMRHKRGHYIPVEIAGVICYDVVVCVFHLQESTEVARMIHFYSPVQRTLIKYQVSYDQYHRVMSLPDARMEECGEITLEPRICLIIDRFTKQHIIQYASQATNFLLGYEASAMIGTPLLKYVAEQDISLVRDMLLASKSKLKLYRFMFTFKTLLFGEIPMEAISCSGSESLVLTLRIDPRMLFLHDEDSEAGSICGV
ncbi:hypothetical protein K7432_008491 [Basidiobolus ranarum]|uniref:PAS domain-containing protein n=1 Tax=Basidiobolus ranarum TaxID=34480 RepID=A0ABR2VYG9_9FUNG